MFMFNNKLTQVTQPCFSSSAETRILFYCLSSATFLHLCALVILLFKVTPRHSAEVLSHVREVQEVRAARDVPAVQRE